MENWSQDNKNNKKGNHNVINISMLLNYLSVEVYVLNVDLRRGYQKYIMEVSKHILSVIITVTKLN